MKSKIYEFLRKYKHSILILYFPLYMAWFEWLEHRKVSDYFVMESPLDSYIPFCELFVIPYLLWFIYVVAVLVFLFTQTNDLGNFYRCTAVLMLGMTTCLMIYTLWPNMQPLRPETLPRNNVLTRIVAGLYKGDTPTNVCPSIHVYNSLAIHAGICKSKYFKEKRGIKCASLILCILICMSTVMLKQHSVIDVICAILLFGFYYTMIYKTPLSKKNS